MPYVVTLLNRTHTFGFRYMAWLVVKNGDQKDTCYDEISLCDQKSVDTVLGSILNFTIGKAYVIT